MRIGIGFDMHRFSKKMGLVLGQVKFDYRALEGASEDVDVLLHAISDAILGAAGKEDIGTLFPPEKFKGISSRKILEEVIKMIKREGFEIKSVDSVIIAQEPKIGPKINQIKYNVSQILKSSFNVKVKSPEGIGTFGRTEGIGAMAVALLVAKKKSRRNRNNRDL